MTVYFVVKSSSLSSNKPEKIEINKDEIAYKQFVKSNNGGVGDTVYILQPKLDKLSLVFNVEDHDYQKAIKTLLLSALEDGATWFQEAKGGAKPKTYWIEAVLTPPGGKHSILIQVDPKKKTEPKPAFMRFEFNPHKLGKPGLQFFKDHLIEWLVNEITFEDFKQSGKVTRLDIACDLVNVRLSDLVFRSLKPGKSHVYFGFAGAVETAYLGLKKNKAGKKQPSNLMMYDKSRELLDAERQPKYGPVPHTRIEVVTRPNLSLPKLVKLKNPLSKLEVFGVGKTDPPEALHHWHFFLDSCRYRGVDAALGLLPPDLREQYHSALLKAKQEIWRPQEIWKTWPSVVAASGLLD